MKRSTALENLYQNYCNKLGNRMFAPGEDQTEAEKVLTKALYAKQDHIVATYGHNDDVPDSEVDLNA